MLPASRVQHSTYNHVEYILFDGDDNGCVAGLCIYYTVLLSLLWSVFLLLIKIKFAVRDCVALRQQQSRSHVSCLLFASFSLCLI